MSSRSSVVDAKVPRAKAAFHTILPGLAFLVQAPWLVAATGLVMAVSVLGGPRLSLFGRLYAKLIQPLLKLSPGEPEAAAPHRFAEALGAIFLLFGAGILLANPASVVGWGAALLVFALAALNWIGGFCVGCKVYVLLSRLRARSGVEV